MNREFLVWKILLILFISMLVGTNVFAIPINVGDKIIISDGPGPYASIPAGIGGAYSASSPDNLWEDFVTFCLEVDESLNFGGTFNVGAITTSADRGGINTNSGDDLSSFTAYLYTQAVNGVFNDEQLDDVQYAIWHEEQELETLIGDKLDFYDRQKINFTASSWIGLGSVRVINLKDSEGNYRQDLLVTVPVPEPATMLLLGLGIVGLAGFGRKKFLKKNKLTV